MRIYLVPFLLCAGCGAVAQQSFFSQHNYAIPESAPAMIAIDNYASLTLIYKNQGLIGSDHLISTLLFAKYPIINYKNHRLAVAINFAENRIKGPGKFTEQQFTSSLAYSFNYASHEGISFAMDYGLVTKRVNLKDIQTGLMWTIENGFDPSLSPGENLAKEKFAHPKLNASLYWFANDKNGDTKSYLGFSVFQLNNFFDSFYITDKPTKNKQFTVLGGIRIYDVNRVALIPKFLFTSNASRSYVKIGMDFNYSLARYKSNVSRKENSFNFEVNYQMQKGAQFGLQYLQPQYVVGMAYHFDISNKTKSNVFNNAIEIVFVLRNPVATALKKRRGPRGKKTTIKQVSRGRKETNPKTAVAAKEQIDKNDSIKSANSSLADSIDMVHTSSAITQIDQPDSIKDDNWEANVLLGKVDNLHFDYNSTKINQASYKKLTRLAALFKAYSNAQILLIGHTDSIGSEASNTAFSIRRAEAAARVLKELGVPSSKIIVQGKGESKPVDTNLTEKGRRNNRRIEFYIINK